ncbi:MAG: heme NO-binding protein, partial [Phycisphaeraceae bacterium]|nr:heme NO-binding protein [Phycisphaeraceae bacterium]
GLGPLVVGLVKGLAERFGRQVDDVPTRVGEGDDAHDAFEIIYRDGNVAS